MKRFSIAQVTHREAISPNMVRITLQADAIKAFPPSAAGGHIKLVIPSPRDSFGQFERTLSGFGLRKNMRTYTVRHLRQALGEIDIDFVAHGLTGPASAWALSAEIGDFIGLSSPGAPKLKTARSNQYVLAVDMTGFPAAAAGLEALPDDAQGDVYASILSERDIQPVLAPDGVSVHWIVNADAETGGRELARAVRAHPLSGDESVFVAGEYETVGQLRSYFRDEQAYPKDQLYISSYWKRGLVEPQHKRIKTLVA